MTMRKATYDDVDTIMRIIAQAQKRLRVLGVDQWQNGYPNRDTITADIDDGNGYVYCPHNAIAAYAAVIFGDEPNYKHIDGKWLSAEPYATVHRIAVAEEMTGRGIATEFMQNIEAFISGRGTDCIRIDTHSDNTYMQALLAKHEFVYRGIIRVNDGTPRRAYEKVLQ